MESSGSNLCEGIYYGLPTPSLSCILRPPSMVDYCWTSVADDDPTLTFSIGPVPVPYELIPTFVHPLFRTRLWPATHHAYSLGVMLFHWFGLFDCRRQCPTEHSFSFGPALSSEINTRPISMRVLCNKMSLVDIRVAISHVRELLTPLTGN